MGSSIIGLPLKMVLSPFRTNHNGQAATQYGVSLELRAEDMKALRARFEQNAWVPSAITARHVEEIEMVPQLSAPSIAAEFYPEAVDITADYDEEDSGEATDAGSVQAAKATQATTQELAGKLAEKRERKSKEPPVIAAEPTPVHVEPLEPEKPSVPVTTRAHDNHHTPRHFPSTYAVDRQPVAGAHAQGLRSIHRAEPVPDTADAAYWAAGWSPESPRTMSSRCGEHSSHSKDATEIQLKNKLAERGNVWRRASRRIPNPRMGSCFRIHGDLVVIGDHRQQTHCHSVGVARQSLKFSRFESWACRAARGNPGMVAGLVVATIRLKVFRRVVRPPCGK